MKNIGVPVVIDGDGDNLPSQVRIGLTDLPNIEAASCPPAPPPRFPVPASLPMHVKYFAVCYTYRDKLSFEANSRVQARLWA